MHRTTLLLLTTLIAAAGWNVAQAQPSNPDIARYMPAETAVYIGWARDFDPQDTRQVKEREMLRTVANAPLIKQVCEQFDVDAEVFASAADVLYYAPIGIGLLDITVEDDVPDVQVAMIIESGDQTRQLVACIDAMMAALGKEAGFEVTTRSVGGTSFQAAPLADGDMPVLWTGHGAYTLMTLGDTAATKALATLRGDAPTLAAQDELQFVRGKVDAELSGNFFCMYFDFQRVIDRALEIADAQLGGVPPMVPMLLDELGIRALRSKYMHATADDTDKRMAVFAHLTGPRRGILRLYDQAPLAAEDLVLIPQDAYWAQVTNLNLAELWNGAISTTESINPEAVPMVQGSVAMVGSMLGMSIPDQLLPAFGDTWMLYDEPSHGGLLMTGTVLVAEVRSEEAIQRFLHRIVQMAAPFGAEEDVQIELKQTTYQGQTIHYCMISAPGGGASPAWAFVKDRWVFGLTPQTVAAAARQLGSASHPRSLLNHRDVAQALPEVPDNCISFGYFNSEYIARMFYPVLNIFQNSGMTQAARLGIELDLELMPPIDEYTADIHSYVATTTTHEEGVLYEAVGAGSELILGAAAGSAVATSIALPALAQARKTAKQTVSASQLRAIGQGLLIYAIDHNGRFPESLQALIDEDFLTEDSLRSPLDPRPGQSYVYITGQNSDGDVRNILAYERLHPGRDTTLVLFGDTRVVNMSLPDFKRALRETYSRLGREDEMPAELR